MIITTDQAQQKRSLLAQAIHLQKAGKLNKAATAYQKLVRAEPNNAVAWANYASVLHQLGNPAQGLLAVNKAFALNVNHPLFYFNKGLILQALNRYQEALLCYEIVLRNNPRDVGAFNESGFCFASLGDYDRAIYCYERALQIMPNADSFVNAGDVYYLRSEHAKADVCYRKSLELNPQNPAVIHFNLGLTSERVYGVAKALEQFEKALQWDPSYHKVFVPLLRLKQEICDWSDREALQEKVLVHTQKELTLAKSITINPFLLYSLPWDNKLKFACIESKVKSIKQHIKETAEKVYFQHDKAQPQRLRIAYISCDFADHPIGHLTANMFGFHDREKVEIFVYSFGEEDDSVYRKKIKEKAEHFIDIRELNFVECAKRIHRDNINILIDLTGHMTSNRMEIFALKPAPIQVTYLNTPMTTAADFYDYLIGDALATPLAHASCFSEKLVLMPHTFWIANNEDVIDAAPVSRADYGLLDDQFVYCCFNALYKVEPMIFAIWMNILKAVPNSVLWLINKYEEQCDNLHREAEQHGVDRQRIIFTKRLPREKHLARLQLADLFLDTYYINAHTTASDALWAGLPVLACPGNDFVSRGTLSFLTNIGLTEMLTNSLDEYQRMAIHLANHPQQMQQIRQKLQKNRTEYPLFNTAERVKELEQVYQTMWQRFQQGLPAEHLY